MWFNYKTLRRIRHTILSLVVSLATLAGAICVEQERNADEEYAVYSAYLSEGLLNNAHDWSVGGAVEVLVRDTTKAGGNLRLRGLYLLDGRIRFDRLDTSTRVSYLLRNLFETRIRSKFVLPSRAKAIIVSESDIQSYGSSEFQERFPRNMGFITLSGVGFSHSHIQAVFYIDHSCGLCGGGRYVLMEKINGSWQVRDERYTWIS